MSIYKLASSIQRSFLCDITKQTGYLSYLGSKLRYLHNRCSINDYTERSHTCGQVTIDTVGQRVSLFGWVKFTRFDNKMISLRDSYGSIQCVVDRNISKSDLRKLKIPKESVLKVSGTIQRRAIEHVNLNEKNGDVEIAVDELVLINPARTDLPLLTGDTDDHTLENRLKHRHLDLRDGRMQEALRARSAIYQILRKRLVQLGFVECDTPTLYRRTPGGANEFIVPSQVDNKFYSLTQSPQQLKQLLMISGLDRYFQICRCYRDETCRTDRQPEFTQLDIELSFTNQNLVMKLVDDIIHNLLSNMNESMNMHFDLDSIFLNGSIQMMTHHEAIKNYGTDKPDLRFGWSIKNCTEGIKIEVPFNLNQELIDKVITSIKAANSDYEEFKLQTRSSLKHEDGSSLTILSVNDKSMSSRIFLGLIRSRLATELLKDGNNVFDHTHKLVWITSFPLFEVDHVSGKIQSTHHPFTAPSEETAPLLEKNPLSVIGQHYDLVLNGQEIAGGSIRNHDPHVQKFIFDNILKVDEGTFEYFIDALRGGCPPHGGIAFGMDRLIAILLNRNSIREVIAFPKSSSGRDVMTDTPHELDTATKKLYHLT